MYIIYGQKRKGQDNDPFPLNSQISILADLFDNKCWIFSMPGHMSRGNNASTYLEKLNELIGKSSTNEQYIGFGNGYHSYEARGKYISEINRLSSENPSGFLLRNYSVSIPKNIRHNHSKVLIYYSWKNNNSNLKNSFEDGKLGIPEIPLDVFIDSIDVKAVIIGSSNQSFNTYFSEHADKGEADILLLPSGTSHEMCTNTKNSIVHDIALGCGMEIRNDFFDEDHNDFFENNLISKTVLPLQGNMRDDEFLKSIFKNCLTEELY